uniref:Protein FAM89A n=1 Tax=Varanus komodoensis TaxID=61221 RepID=A0A8D2LUM2_VARKO
MSLLCQLYSLYESIQEYKGACQAVSSADCAYALENDHQCLIGTLSAFLPCTEEKEALLLCSPFISGILSTQVTHCVNVAL